MTPEPVTYRAARLCGEACDCCANLCRVPPAEIGLGPDRPDGASLCDHCADLIDEQNPQWDMRPVAVVLAPDGVTRCEWAGPYAPFRRQLRRQHAKSEPG